MEKNILDLRKKMDLLEQEFIPYGFNKAKIDLKVLDRLKDKENGKLILVTAINPTPAGEGKTTVSIGLTQGLNEIGKKAIVALREPSLGPVFGVKGGATGGGKSSVTPQDDINLHFTGDLHAITSANNLLSALIDNHIFHGNELELETVTWTRAIDINDRSLRAIETPVRKDGFVITAASEVMATLALSSDLEDLKMRLNRILIGYNKNDEPVFLHQLGGADSMVMLLKDAINPNLVQTIDGVPAFIHCGPFANIAHGCNSLVATRMALKLADYTVTEAGFGADLGMEKFLHLKMPYLNKTVDAVVLVATIRALKAHGGAENFNVYDLEALKRGMPHLEHHLKNIKGLGLNYVIALNHFYNDSQEEVNYLMNWAKENNHPISLSKGFAEGGKGTADLADLVVQMANRPNNFKPLYDETLSVKEKVEKIAKTMYGAKEVVFTKKATEQLKKYKEFGWNLPVCMAKTPLSLSGDASLKGVPQDFTLTIQEIRPSFGAGFLVARTKGIMIMPGLNKTPRAMDFRIDKDGNVTEVERD